MISPEVGAGWSTWNGEHRDVLLFDAEIVQAVLDGDADKAALIAKRKCADAYTGGSGGLTVRWLDKGSVFEVEEYDGSESLHVIGERNYAVA